MGLGGMLFWTVLAKEIFKKENKKVVFIDNKKRIIKNEVFINNPYISFTKNEDIIEVNLKSYKNFNHEMKQKEHGIISRCKYFGYNPTNIHPILNYTEDEEKKINDLLKILPKKFICIEPHAKTSWTPNKTFPFKKWQTIVDELIKNGYIIVQVSIPGNKLLNNVIDFRDKLNNFRECACLLKYCTLFLSTEGGLMHASVANNNNSFILYSPIFHPSYTLYDNVNYMWIHSKEHNCCYKKKKCNECLKLMKNFDEYIIVSKILKLLN